MWLWLIFVFVTPVIMIFAGWMMWKHCPKDINGLVGYRTTRSMKNMDTWQFAHDFCGRLWWKIGFVMLAGSALVFAFVCRSDEKTIGIAVSVLLLVQCAVMIASIVPTEKALKNTFNDDGTRK
mgnify:FL=1